VDSRQGEEKRYIVRIFADACEGQILSAGKIEVEKEVGEGV
jgi:hypothetical protein